MMREIIICPNHYIEEPSSEKPTQYPNTTSDRALEEGWRELSGRYICPACVAAKIRERYNHLQDAKMSAARERNARQAELRQEIEAVYSRFLERVDELNREYAEFVNLMTEGIPILGIRRENEQ